MVARGRLPPLYILRHIKMLFQALALALAVAAPVANAQEGTEDICELRKKVGPCRALIPRFFHNAKTGECEEFSWGGCQPNANNFETFEECKAACDPEPVDPCLEPKKVGPCRAAIPRFFFNADAGQCEGFLWGGCQPNGNNFETLEECEGTCPSIDTCELEKKVGPCKALIPRFFHNAKTGECEEFNWGGCQPNANNFETLEECKAACDPQPVDPCAEPKKVGPCRAAVPRFFFNSKSGRCEGFTWGGCQPNGNNFETLEECEGTCGR
eukprot:jgi/Ulvmu1/6814/UM031_0018.1